jgi:transcriptional regulator with XRE-family HTH domain
MNRIWLERKRNIAGITHQNVADKCNITRAYYTLIESGARTPSVSVAKKIAKCLNFNWNIFFNDECNDTKQNDHLSKMQRTG